MALNIAGMIGDTLGGAVQKIVGSFKEDPTKKAEFQAAVDAHEAEFKLAQLELQAKIQDAANAEVLAQIAVNEADAKGNLYQSSWRPTIGYICGAGLGYQFLLRPLLNFAATMLHSTAVAGPLEIGTLMTLLFGMLGLGALRTVDKNNGTS